jgi:hypothetical protein
MVVHTVVLQAPFCVKCSISISTKRIFLVIVDLADILEGFLYSLTIKPTKERMKSGKDFLSQNILQIYLGFQLLALQKKRSNSLKSVGVSAKPRFNLAMVMWFSLALIKLSTRLRYWASLRHLKRLEYQLLAFSNFIIKHGIHNS